MTSFIKFLHYLLFEIVPGGFYWWWDILLAIAVLMLLYYFALRFIFRKWLRRLSLNGLELSAVESSLPFEPYRQAKAKQNQVLTGLQVDDYSASSKYVMPLSGELIKLELVPDPVFSSKVMGDGFAIKPSANVLVSPADGIVTMLFKTKHACIVTTAEGVEILMHIGVDTVNLSGEGFKALLETGSIVRKGTPLIQFDLYKIAKSVPSIITPIIFTNLIELNKKLLITGYHIQYNAGNSIEILLE